MSEFKKPTQQHSGMLFLIVSVVIASMFFVIRWSSFATAGASPQAHAYPVAGVSVHNEAKQTVPSMNMLERPLFKALSFVRTNMTHRSTGSWGWAIVLLTVLVNMILLPFRVISMRNAAKMKRIQPEMDAIKNRYQGISLGDPRRAEMSAEIAALQKENGINMFGGCLPLLIQMPLLWAFFGMLRNAGSLRGAEWLWLPDLSSADPYHVLPILMVVSQLLVQLYTPSPGVDATQQKIMTFVMTMTFGFVSWHYAAGVALYALTGSVFSIATQAVMNCCGIAK